jgi:hypothetical protein
MFKNVSLRGRAGSIVWNARAAATVGAWVATRDDNRQWTLHATVATVDTFCMRQVPLLFQAPRVHKPAGYWVWPIRTVKIDRGTLTAALDPPEGN